ncbi:non-reducing end alpha-L-arabinofuranosidase family hydrolase [Streptomyces sp. NBC_01429]|uniref:non-reducing end alpha-L-arabinofuranosidase family hydrolase n=1 Tax=Streptomyces sp. NBC_01429 TaxID=2903862 RepID=UPI002E290D13|nr:non-reducing end alpha-L-arabinofuranosidase family hydrolase [Streptomyces sp. NBC_01429]
MWARTSASTSPAPPTAPRYRSGTATAAATRSGPRSEDSPRVYRAWTSPSLDGAWTQIANPFAGLTNVTFPNGQWTNDVSHGELIRTGYDQTMEIDPCDLRLLYQGVDPGSTNVPYSQLPYQLGLLTQTNPC